MIIQSEHNQLPTPHFNTAMMGVQEDEPMDDEYFDDYETDDGASSASESENDSCYAIPNDALAQELAADPRRPTLWKNLKLGKTIIQVSSMGVVKRHDSLFEHSTKGNILEGTPYRTYSLEYETGDIRQYLVHELVWLAFKGPVPQGWVVRHRHSYTMHARKSYSNALHHLDAVLDTVHSAFGARPKVI